MIVISEHMRFIDRIVVYGECTSVNSLMNHPLKCSSPPLYSSIQYRTSDILQLLILGEWAMDVGPRRLRTKALPTHLASRLRDLHGKLSKPTLESIPSSISCIEEAAADSMN